MTVSCLKVARGRPMNRRTPAEDLARARRVVLVGLGNIGSRLAMELPLVGVRQLLLVDGDRASTRNLYTSWAFGPEDLGRFKVDLIARQIRRSFPRVAVHAAACTLDRLGLARLGDEVPAVLVGAVDSRCARYALAEAALCLGMPLIDLGIPAAGPSAARVQVTWQAVRPIDPLNAWSAEDWNLLEQVRPCGAREPKADGGPVASSLSGMAAAVLGAAAIGRLFRGDLCDVGWECRTELVHSSTVRRRLLADGLSPLDSRDAIRGRPPLCRAPTLGGLVDFAERRFGRGAVLRLNREISFGFLCCGCGAHAGTGPVERPPCPRCGQALVPVRPLTLLSRDTMGGHGREPVARLGIARDLLRVQGRTERRRGWMQYCGREAL